MPVLPSTTESVGLLGRLARSWPARRRASAEEVLEVAATTAVVAAAVLTMKLRRLRWSFMTSPLMVSVYVAVVKAFDSNPLLTLLP